MEKGKKFGKKEDKREEKKEIVKKMKEKGARIKYISEITGLNTKEIEKL